MIFLRFIVSYLITIHNNNVFKNFEMIIHEFDGKVVKFISNFVLQLVLNEFNCFYMLILIVYS